MRNPFFDEGALPYEGDDATFWKLFAQGLAQCDPRTHEKVIFLKPEKKADNPTCQVIYEGLNDPNLTEAKRKELLTMLLCDGRKKLFRFSPCELPYPVEALYGPEACSSYGRPDLGSFFCSLLICYYLKTGKCPLLASECAKKLCYSSYHSAMDQVDSRRRLANLGDRINLRTSSWQGYAYYQNEITGREPPCGLVYENEIEKFLKSDPEITKEILSAPEIFLAGIYPFTNAWLHSKDLYSSYLHVFLTYCASNRIICLSSPLCFNEEGMVVFPEGMRLINDKDWAKIEKAWSRRKEKLLKQKN